jgi:hypothetical protein
MRSSNDVERFLSESAVPFQDFGDGMYVVTDDASGLHNLAIKVADEIVVFQLRVMPIPEQAGSEREALFEKLLRLNGDGLLHAAFSLQSDGVYLQAALPLQNLDPNEMQAVLDDMGLAVSQYVPQLLDSQKTKN